MDGKLRLPSSSSKNGTRLDVGGNETLWGAWKDQEVNYGLNLGTHVRICPYVYNLARIEIHYQSTYTNLFLFVLGGLCEEVN